MHVDPEFEFSEDAMIDNDINVEWVAGQQHVLKLGGPLGLSRMGMDVLIIAHHFKLHQRL